MNDGRKRGMILILVTLLLVAAAAPLMTGASPEPNSSVATVRLSPQEEAIAVGESITLDILIDDVQDLYAIDLRFTFDPSMVSVPAESISVDRGMFPAGSLIFKNQVDNAGGAGQIALFKMNPDVPFSGSGKIGEVTLQGVGQGYVAIELDEVTPTNRDGDILDVANVNAILAVGDAGPTPTPSPTPVPVGVGAEHTILLPFVHE